jgi:plastocyanin
MLPFDRMRRIALLLALLSASSAVSAASLVVTVRDARGGAVSDAVVYAVPVGRRVPAPSKPAVMDQKNRQFLPRVLAIQAGTSVKFPNSDNVRHQVYSFSTPKKFQLPLYEGTPAAPIVFDKAGVVVLGCNIHDRMSAVIVVVDTPHFAMAEKGRARIGELPMGKYDVSVWYPGAKDGTNPQSVSLAAGEARELVITVGSE